MKYSYPQVVVAEVPDEISLALSISGCPLHCKGCHSSETWDKNFGKELTKERLCNLIKTHKYISCVLFYGGEWELPTLYYMCTVVKSYGLKTALYTGLNDITSLQEFKLLQVLDYIKYGAYKEKLGGLSSSTTNQRLFSVSNGKLCKELFLNKGINL